MYVTSVPNRNSPPAILVRESFRQDGKVKNRTVANISKLPKTAIEAIRRALAGQTLVSAEDAFDVVASYHHGHVEAVLTTMRRLGFDKLIANKRSPKRDLLVAMVAARVLDPRSKAATTRSWGVTSLPRILGVSHADEDDLYAAMDWLVERQGAIEKKLASRHLKEGDLALFDLTSTYFEGVTCPLAQRGYSRDKKQGKLQVNYGLMTDGRGCPVAVSVFDGNVGDPKTLLPQVEKTRTQFGIERFVIVGDRGMITQKQINSLQLMKGMDYVTALRSEGVKKLVNSGPIQMGLFDERNMLEIQHEDYPGERLMVCRNPEMANRRSTKRQSLIEATVQELEKVRRMAKGNRLQGKDAISTRIQSVLRHYRIRTCLRIDIRDDGFDFEIDEEGLLAQAQSLGGSDSAQVAKQLAQVKRHAETLGEKLQAIRRKTQQGRLHGKAAIGLRVGKVINKHKVAKHFKLEIQDDRFDYVIDEEKIAAEAAMDGLYVVRTSLPKEEMAAEDAVRSYKMLAQVERAFRSLKSIDLLVRPIRHFAETRVRGHIFLCMLAYYVKWHMLEAWRPLLFADEDQAAKALRDPVKPARRSQSAMDKVRTKTLPDGSPVHSFHTLLHNLSSIVLNVCRAKQSGDQAPTFEMVTTPSDKQCQALDHLKTIRP